jgi:hypothetical protein
MFFMILASCKSSETKNTSSLIVDTPEYVDSLNYIQTIKNFLQWYKSNFEDILKIQLVDLRGDGITAQYRVNSTNTDKYLALLKSSGMFSSKYLEAMEEYFKKGDIKLVEHKQNDGPPIGFEHDLLLLTQEPEYLLENSENVKYEIMMETELYAIVIVDNDLSFKIDKRGLIDSISK